MFGFVFALTLPYLCVMDRSMVEVLAELGRRMAEHPSHAARNIARDMLAPEALSEWMAGWRAEYPALPVAVARNVLIITAGNIPFVGVQDLVCVLAAGHRAIVKPSSRDKDNMEWVVEQLLDIDPEMPVSSTDGSLSAAPDAVIAMGADGTVAAIGEKYAGVPALLRGNRSSLAVLDGSESAGELAGLADDVLMYSGLGCRNVSLVWVPRGYDLTGLRDVMVRRADGLERKYQGNLRQTRALLRMGGVEHLDCGACLMVEARDFPSAPSILNYTFYESLSETADWIARHGAEIQCVASNCPLSTIHYPLGSTQRPSLMDYPDGRDTMKFLAEI